MILLKLKKNDFDRYVVGGGEVDTRKNTAYIALLVNEFIRLSRLTTDDKDALREILKRKQGLSAEEKLLEVYKFLIKMMKSYMVFDTNLSLFNSRDARLLVRYGIKERRFITKEVLETIESLEL